MDLDALKQVLQARRTLKVLAEPETPWDVPAPTIREHISELLQAVAYAPFHFVAHTDHCQEPLTSPAPWRFHMLDGENCRQLLERFKAENVATGKIANMLAAADALVLATWLPDPLDHQAEFQEFAATQRNMEHIAAASSAIQNLLLLATAGGWNTYWSSGGFLRSEMVYRWTGIDLQQVLLGAVFLFPSDTASATVKPGANRDRQGPTASWSRWVTL